VLGLNCEVISHRLGLLSEININTAPSFLRCQIDAALSAYTPTLNFFAYHDVILEIDRQAKRLLQKCEKCMHIINNENQK